MYINFLYQNGVMWYQYVGDMICESGCLEPDSGIYHLCNPYYDAKMSAGKGDSLDKVDNWHHS